MAKNTTPPQPEIRIERLAQETGNLRLSGWKDAQSVVISEKEFIEVIHQAIHAGALSPDFVEKLRAWIEI